MPTVTRELLAEYLREPRKVRRAVSRDVARRYPVPPRSALYQPDPRKPVPRRMRRDRGQVAALPRAFYETPVRPPSTRSGQARINAKRNERAAFWADWAEARRTVRVRVSAEFEPHFREHLGLFGEGARIHGSTPDLYSFSLDLDVHIPSAPADAAEARPVYEAVYTQDRHVPRLLFIEWLRADGSRIEIIDLPVLV
jgi:hypothetical protein